METPRGESQFVPIPGLRHAFWAAAFALAALAPVAKPPIGSPKSPKSWVFVDYGTLVDRRRLTHSGDSVGTLLERLGGRPRPPLTERSETALSHRLLDPILEPYAFVLPDTIDSMFPRLDPPLVEVGGLWDTGEAQPAWVELARARRLLLESDGEGRLRAFLPAPSLEAALFPEDPPAQDPVAVAHEAWDAAWPVLRHAMAGELRRLKTRTGLEVSVFAYRHAPERSRFLLGARAWTTTVRETGPSPGTAPLDLAALDAMLGRRLRIEGGRIEGGGRIRWFTSESEAKPAILGRPTALSDLAVAYRSIAHGGYGEPYMSLERAVVPQIAVVNYGGRLRDTALGMVSLLADVRFKTFSVGIDLLGPGDVRAAVRRTIPGFKTHLERFAADPTAGAVMSQQTRLWFRPDDVDLTLSPEQDVCAFRRARMTAVSERVLDAADDPTATEPPWTKATTAFINAQYDELASLFPEMTELNETVRWLAVFAWLESARMHGVKVPDLDALMAVDLPAMPTPRRFPQLLSYDVLPRPGGSGPVDVLDRTSLGTALDRLEPADGRPLPAGVRFRRARAMLDPLVPDQAALAASMDAEAATADVAKLDLLSFRAERLMMHARILATLSAGERTAVAARRSAEDGSRVFSIGIGGVDLGTQAILARAIGRSSKGGLTSTAPRIAAPAADEAVAAASGRSADPPGLPESVWPEHGLGPAPQRIETALGESRGSIAARRRPGSLVRRGTWNIGDGRTLVWDEWIEGIEGTEARSRRRIPDVEGKMPVFERFEDGRRLSYRLEPFELGVKAVSATAQIPDEALGVEPPAQDAPIAVPPGLAMLQVIAPRTPEPTATVTLRVRTSDGRDRSAEVPPALLQRLTLGRTFDLNPQKPLPAFTPASQLLGEARTLMIAAGAAERLPPWAMTGSAPPGEQDASRLARALCAWWSQSTPPEPASAVVGVEPVSSLTRWAAAPRGDGGVAVLAPDDAFPGLTDAARARLAMLPASAPASRVVLLVSAESPGVLGRRLRALATDPAFSGKIVAVVALGGAPREDLAASLLAERQLRAIGIFEAGPVGIPEAIDAAATWAKAAGAEGAKGKRVEELPGPFTWFF